MSTSTELFTLTVAGQDYILFLGFIGFLFAIAYRMFVDYYSL